MASCRPRRARRQAVADLLSRLLADLARRIGVENAARLYKV